MDKAVVLAHFGGNFTPFYQKYLPKIFQNGGKEMKALCPFHEEKEPSFSFNITSGQYYCHGCGKKGDPIHFFAKTHDLDTKKDFGKILSGIAHDFGIHVDEVKSRVVATYDYVDEAGKLLYQVCRMDPKDFRQRRPDGKGGWIWDLKNTQKVLYRLPALQTSEDIIIVEGEKDVISLRALGFVATCNPGGAGKWLPEFSDHLKDKHVVLIPDNDQPGRQHMVKVAQALQGIAASIKWLDIPNLPTKGDVSDFIASFTDQDAAVERLAIMIQEAKEYAAPKVATIDDAVLTIDQFRSLDIPERRCLLVPWLKEASIIFISGWRGSGKTWMALSILNTISTGGSFGPWKSEFSVPSLFLDGELPPGDIDERIKSLGMNHSPENPIHLLSDAYANLLGLPRAHLANEKWRREMKRVLIARHVKAWVIDNIASLASGLDENSKKDWDVVNQWLLELRFAGITTILLHHTGKGGQQRGTSAREDNADCSILLKKPHDYVVEDGCRFIVNFDKARVSQKHLSLIGDTEFKLIEQPGASYWEWGNVKKERNKEILQMLDEDIPYDTIKDALGCSKAYISQVKAKAIKAGHLTKEGKFTQAGFLFCRGVLDD